MAKSGNSRANENRRIRQDALRESLATGGHLQHVIEISNKLADLAIELDAGAVLRLKAAADIKKGLIAKYMPDLKSSDISLSDPDGSPLGYAITKRIIDASPKG